jgi:nucleotide-binding universal stress UspA family protein
MVEKKAKALEVDFEFILIEGNTVESVENYMAGEENIDTIILGSTRKKIHEKLFFGSVSEKILKITKGKYHPTIILKKM